MSKTVVRGLSKSKGIAAREPYARGWYKFEVKTGVEKESKAGNQMFVHELEILEAPEQPDDRKVEGKKFTCYFPITEKEFTVDKLANFVHAAGVRVASDDGYDPAKAVGKVIWGELYHDTDDKGVPQAKASRFVSEAEYAEKNTASDD
jgi:hypothetical protein